MFITGKEAQIEKSTHTPGIALIETMVSAKCCSLFEKVVDTREGGNVITATAFDNLRTFFRDLTNESISHSYDKSIWIVQQII